MIGGRKWIGVVAQVFRCSLLALIFVPWRALAAGEVSFNLDVRPILSDKCFACHGPDEHERKGKLRLDVADGFDGAYRENEGLIGIQPGSPADSELWHRIISEDEGEVMPPPKAHKNPLSGKERALIKQWIEEGAKYERFWAFEPPKKWALPEVKLAAWKGRSIDRYVLAKMQAAGLSPSPEADRRTLIRRLTLDLTGLPPSREEIAAFVSDSRPGSYERLVETLLSRSSYGEHMGRYWLDLVRFADTNGMHKDFYRNMFAYRDWVIRAFNQNLPFDDFTRYQLAGDLYKEPSHDQLIASGFNRLHLIIDRGTALPEESYTKNVVDRVTAVGTAFMGLTVQCAMCHDHKYDPITQEDFFSLFAFFNNIDAAPETAGRPRGGFQPPFISLPTPEQAAALTALTGKDETTKKKRAKLEGEIQKVMVMRERKDVKPAYILNRGQYDDPGKEVVRRSPGFLPEMKQEGDVASRMDLAEWVVSTDNPLTARVAVNRFWQQLFGVGLVKTSEDLGAQGEVPSHPALLDYLAVTFMESGWDVKALMKEMVMSQTYRQASRATPEAFERDAENRLLARGSRYRMDAEMIRDQILATSGLLSSTMYGPSVKPPQPDGLWKAVTMTGERFRADQGESIYRRSVYTYWKRGMPPPQMTILNAPNRDACVARRERTNTPSQALLLLNEAEYIKAARHLAHQFMGADKRLEGLFESITGRLPDEEEQAELRRLVADLQKMYLAQPTLSAELCEGIALDTPEQRAELAAWTVLANSLYNLDITKNRN